MRYLATKGFAVGNPSVKTLLIQYPELNLHPIEPTRVLGDEMELQSAQHLSGHRRRENLVECCGVVRRESVEHHPHRLGITIVHLDQLMHAAGEIVSRLAFGHLHVPPRLMRIEKYEQVRGAVAPVFLVDARGLTRPRRPWDARLTDEWDRGLIEAHHRSARVGDFAMEVEHLFHPRNVLGIDAGECTTSCAAMA